jgi:hypothetical protein
VWIIIGFRFRVRTPRTVAGARAISGRSHRATASRRRVRRARPWGKFQRTGLEGLGETKIVQEPPTPDR